MLTGKLLADEGKRFAFYGRCSTEDHQNPVTSRAWQWDQASMATASRGLIVAEFFDVDHSPHAALGSARDGSSSAGGDRPAGPALAGR